MRRMILLFAAVSLVLMFAAQPAGARPAGGPIYELDCTYDGADVYYVRPVPGNAVAWALDGSTDPKPFATLLYVIVKPAPPTVPTELIAASPLLTALGDRLTTCAVHGPVTWDGVGWVDDSSWGLPDWYFWGFFFLF